MSAGGSGGATTNVGVALKKGPWSAAEDAVLVDYVRENGEGNWSAVQRNTGLMRSGKSCRLRWANHLRPNLKKGSFSDEEERVVVQLHSQLGNKWAHISSHLPGRTDNEVKNFWNTRMKRRMRQGLPLYPHGLKKARSLTSLLPSPPPLRPLPHFSTAPITLSLFDPIPKHPPSSFFSIHPLPLPPRRHDHLLGDQSSLLAQMVPVDPFQHNDHAMSFGFQLPSVQRTQAFNPCTSSVCQPKPELPSNQIFQNPFDEVNVENPSAGGRGNSGLLDALLQEARVRAGRRMDFTETLDGCDDHDAIWEKSNSENADGNTGRVKKEEKEAEVDTGNQDLLSILNLIPGLVQAPKWCNNNNNEEASAGQSSGVTDDNNIGLELLNSASFPGIRTMDYNRDKGSSSWDNLPKIC